MESLKGSWEPPEALDLFLRMAALSCPCLSLLRALALCPAIRKGCVLGPVLGCRLSPSRGPWPLPRHGLPKAAVEGPCWAADSREGGSHLGLAAQVATLVLTAHSVKNLVFLPKLAYSRLVPIRAWALPIRHPLVAPFPISHLPLC